jgi:hypothetical protein
MPVVPGLRYDGLDVAGVPWAECLSNRCVAFVDRRQDGRTNSTDRMQDRMRVLRTVYAECRSIGDAIGEVPNCVVRGPDGLSGTTR